MLRVFFNRRKKEKALENERELLNREHQDRLHAIETEHDRKVFELFQACCEDALRNETRSVEMWTAIQAKIDAAKTEADQIQEETIAALTAEHKRFMDALHALYEKFDYKLTNN